MKVLLAAIYTNFTAAPGAVHNAFYTNIGGRLYFGYAPQTATFPYAVYHLISSNPNWEFFTDTFEDLVVQFSIYSDQSSAVQIGDIKTNCIALYDWCSLSVSGYTFIHMKRSYDNTVWIPEESVWQGVIQYEVYLKKT